MSKRMIAHFSREVWGIPLSLGEVCALEQVVRRAVQEPVDEVREALQWSDTNVDETRWREQNRRVLEEFDRVTAAYRNVEAAMNRGSANARSRTRY